MSRSFESYLSTPARGLVLALCFAVAQVGCAADAAGWSEREEADGDSADVLRQEEGSAPTSASAAATTTGTSA